MVGSGNKKRNAILQTVFVLALLILLNVISAYVFQRIDLTKEKRFTLTKSTKNLVQNLDDVIFIKVYLEGELPAGIKRLRNSTNEMLSEFKSYGGSDIQFLFENPLEGLSDEEKQQVLIQLGKKGIQPTNLQVQDDGAYSESIIFPAASIFYKGRETSVQLLESKIGQGPQQAINSSIALLEYKFANAINTVQRTSTPRVAIIEGHGEMGSNQLQGMVNVLAPFYQVERFNMNDHLYIPDRYKCIIIAKPTESFPEPDKYKIDQYLMNGGSILWFVESMYAELDSLRNNNAFMSVARDLNIDDQLFKYGVRVNKNLVQDMVCNPIPLMTGYLGDTPQYDLFPWLYYPIITSDGQKHPVSKSIDAVMTRFTSTIDFVKVEGVDQVPLLETSPYTKTQFSPVRVHLGMIKDRPDEKQYQGGKKMIAALLEGEFPSAFKNRLTPSTMAVTDTIKAFTNLPKSKPTKMIIVADGDFMSSDKNSAGETLPPGFYKATKETFANIQFTLNALEYLTDNSGLIESRSKEVKLRLLDQGKVKEEKGFWQLLNIVLPMLLIAIFGFVYNFIRRRRYS